MRTLTLRAPLGTVGLASTLFRYLEIWHEQRIFSASAKGEVRPTSRVQMAPAAKPPSLSLDAVVPLSLQRCSDPDPVGPRWACRFSRTSQLPARALPAGALPAPHLCFYWCVSLSG